MALKDWKKTASNKHYIFYTKLVSMYGKKVPNSGEEQVQIYAPVYNRKYWTVTVTKMHYAVPEASKNFKSKSQALKFAKSYMRKH